MNQFTAIGAADNGTHLYVTSDKANIKLVEDVMKIIHSDAVYYVFEGHAKCTSDYFPDELLSLVKKYLHFLEDTNKPLDARQTNEINKLKEYITACEA